MHIYIDTIHHFSQRYPTCGDWQFTTPYGEHCPILTVRVSRMPETDYEFLIAIHEVIEAYMCFRRGIGETDVTAFDVAYEEARAAGAEKFKGYYIDSESEPGDHPLAPYYCEHQFATKIERLLATELDVNWEQYETALSNL